MANHFNSSPGSSTNCWKRDSAERIPFLADQLFRCWSDSSDTLPILVSELPDEQAYFNQGLQRFRGMWDCTPAAARETFTREVPDVLTLNTSNYFDCWNTVDMVGPSPNLRSSPKSSDTDDGDSCDSFTSSVSPISPIEKPMGSGSEDIFVKVGSERHVMNSPSMFYVKAAEGRRLQKSYFFNITVEYPGGRVKQLTPYQEKAVPDSFYCSFEPKETGSFKLSVCLNSPVVQHVSGSPLLFHVSRNYLTTLDNTFVRLGFPPTTSVLAKAWGLAVHRPTSTIYATDRESHQIIVMDADGVVKRKFGKHGHGRGQLYRPTGVAVDHAKNRVFVTDKDNHRVSCFTLEGAFLSDFGKKGHQNGEFNYPWGIAVSPKGDYVVVADSRNHRIQLFDSNGKFLRKYSVFEINPFEYKSEFNYPRGITFGLDGTSIYVTDFNIHAVFKLDLEFTRREAFIPHNTLLRPQGVTTDEAGNILVADSKHNSIRVIAPDGTFVHNIELTGTDTLNMPMDVAVLDGGRLAVTDGVNRLRIF